MNLIYCTDTCLALHNIDLLIHEMKTYCEHNINNINYILPVAVSDLLLSYSLSLSLSDVHELIQRLSLSLSFTLWLTSHPMDVMEKGIHARENEKRNERSDNTFWVIMNISAYIELDLCT